MSIKEKGFAHILVFLLLIAGLGTGLYLVSHPTIFKPKATNIVSNVPETSFHLSEDTSTIHPLGQEFTVNLEVRSDTDAGNVFTAKMQFPSQYISVSRIETSNSFIKNWVENHYDNNAGMISLIGGIPTPGFATQVGQPPAVMARITFRADHPTPTAAGQHIVFTPDSAIYRDTDNVNILGASRDFLFGIVALTPSPSVISQCGACYPAASGCFNETCGAGSTGEVPGCRQICPNPSPSPSGLTFNCQRMYNHIQNSYQATCNSANYDVIADINKDGRIDSLDFSLLAVATSVGDDKACYKMTINYQNACQQPSPVPSPTNGVCQFACAQGTMCIDGQCVAVPSPSPVPLPLPSPTPIQPYCQDWQSYCSAFGVTQCWASFLCPDLAPSPSPVLRPSRAPAATGIRGDGNHDGKVNVVDLSVLLSNFGKREGFPKEIDLNSDGLINVIDYSEMVRLLTSLGIVVPN